MKFNVLVDNLLEDFKAPIDNNLDSKVLPGKFTNQNSQLDKAHSTKAISGFKGKPGGKQKIMKFAITNKKEKKSTKEKQST
tara:strand:- start:29 stop:271 length:243 start_codon:yes stop_codon:yes gene_type:complete